MKRLLLVLMFSGVMFGSGCAHWGSCGGHRHHGHGCHGEKSCCKSKYKKKCDKEKCKKKGKCAKSCKMRKKS